jgi:signal transduction histidine kinase
MEPRMAKRNLIPVEYLLRVCAWLLFLNAEKVVDKALSWSAGVFNYYSVTIVFTILLLVSFRILGRSQLIRDLQEICLYDVFVQIYGYFFATPGSPSGAYLILANAVLLLKFLRLTWFGKNEGGALLAGWPVFGIIGYFDKHRLEESIGRWQKLGIYVACGMSLVLAYIASFQFKQFPTEILHGMSLAAVLLFTWRAVRDIEASEEGRIAEARKNEAYTARLKADAYIKERNEELCHGAHDLQRPLYTMRAITKELLASNDVAHIHALATRYQHGIAELHDRLNDLIAMARITTEAMSPTAEVVDMGRMARHLQSTLAPIANAKGIPFYVDDAICKVVTNAWLLERLISNLVINAIAHGNSKTKVRLWIYASPTRCHIRIWDLGPGMIGANGPDRAANFTNLVNRITQNQRTQYDNGMSVLAGHGLGLRSVQRICNTLQIRMTLISKPLKGTLYRFSVPLANPEEIAAKLLPEGAPVPLPKP